MIYVIDIFIDIFIDIEQALLTVKSGKAADCYGDVAKLFTRSKLPHPGGREGRAASLQITAPQIIFLFCSILSINIGKETTLCTFALWTWAKHLTPSTDPNCGNKCQIWGYGAARWRHSKLTNLMYENAWRQQMDTHPTSLLVLASYRAALSRPIYSDCILMLCTVKLHGTPVPLLLYADDIVF